ncbi:hypothetical protein BT96DRAFT_949695 [Gymnopus androsaceus JB14]|uniref:Endonuclease/exonuclease/phosphatase domain-containing protein n=1 Tax=Gymnopus androsaceus JB14 TaxID=1447944 RepID=A0A6A4GJU9_9AGAR|nr:hypothetical protein BT96DRAFT_949695 [Gymnopus androsaceus JB14]
MLTNNESEYINLEKLLLEFTEDALSWCPVSAIQLVIRMLGITGSAKAPSSRKWKLCQKVMLGASKILEGVCRKLEELEGFLKDGKETWTQLKVPESKIGMVLLAMGQRDAPDSLTPAQALLAPPEQIQETSFFLQTSAHLVFHTKKVIINGITTNSIPSRKDHIDWLVERNPILKESLARVYWLRKDLATKLGKEFSLIIMHVYSDNVADKIIRNGIVTPNGWHLFGYKFIKGPDQCYHSQQYGHHSYQCKSPSPICAHCAEPHNTQECHCLHASCCPSTKSCKITLKCALCEGAHFAFDHCCPEQKKETSYKFLQKPSLSPNHWTLITSTSAPPDPNTTPFGSTIYVSSQLKSSSWYQIPIRSMHISAIHVVTAELLFTICNAYNIPNLNNTIDELAQHFCNHNLNISVLLLGNFNKHHAWWAGPNHPARCTWRNLEDFTKLLVDLGMELCLPPGTPTFTSHTLY